MVSRRHKRRTKRRSKRRQTRRLRGGDYRLYTARSMESVALPRRAGVSIAGRSGIFSIQDAEDYKAKVLDDRP